MLAFKGNITYEDYVKTIGNNMTSESFEFILGMEKERGFNYLIKQKDNEKQKKIIATLRTIDYDMDNLNEKDEMYRKLSYFLKVGIVFEEYKELVMDLSPRAISTLLVDNNFSLNDENTRKYMTILSDNELLLYIRDNYHSGERDDIMLAITEYYDNNPFDIYSNQSVINFRKNIVKKLKDNKEKFLNSVRSYNDLEEEVMTSLYGGKK